MHVVQSIFYVRYDSLYIEILIREKVIAIFISKKLDYSKI